MIGVTTGVAIIFILLLITCYIKTKRNNQAVSEETEEKRENISEQLLLRNGEN